VTSPTLSSASLAAFKSATIRCFALQDRRVLVGAQMNVLSFSVVDKVTSLGELLRGSRILSGDWYSFSVNWQLIVPIQSHVQGAPQLLFYFSSSQQASDTLTAMLLNATASGLLISLLIALDPLSYSSTTSASHIFATSQPSLAPTASPSKLSAESFFVSLGVLLYAHLLISTLCTGLVLLLLCVLLGFCVTYRRRARKIRENKAYVEEQVLALQSAVASMVPTTRSNLSMQRSNRVSPQEEYSQIGNRKDDAKKSKSPKGRRTVAPINLKSLKQHILALHAANNQRRQTLGLPLRSMNRKIEEYVAVQTASDTQESFNGKEFKRLQTYFYLLEKERVRLEKANNRSPISSRTAPDDSLTSKVAPLFSIVPMSP